MAAVLPGEGTLLQLGDGATPTEVFTTIPQRTEIDGPGREREMVEKTHLDSTTKEFRGSKVPDNGEIELKILLDPANTVHMSLEDLFESGAARNYRQVYNNETASRPHRQFAAIISAFNSTGMVVEGNLEAEITLKLTGAFARGTTVIA